MRFFFVPGLNSNVSFCVVKKPSPSESPANLDHTPSEHNSQHYPFQKRSGANSPWVDRNSSKIQIWYKKTISLLRYVPKFISISYPCTLRASVFWLYYYFDEQMGQFRYLQHISRLQSHVVLTQLVISPGIVWWRPLHFKNRLGLSEFWHAAARPKIIYFNFWKQERSQCDLSFKTT